MMTVLWFSASSSLSRFISLRKHKATSTHFKLLPQNRENYTQKSLSSFSNLILNDLKLTLLTFLNKSHCCNGFEMDLN